MPAPPPLVGSRAAWLGAAALVVWLPLTGCRGGAGVGRDAGPEPGDPACGLLAGMPRPDLIVAGSGSNIALVRAIADRFMLANPEVEVSVPASIGTSGGVAAVADLAVDIGLASRPLGPEELARGLVYHPHVLSPVVVAAHHQTGSRVIDLATLLDLMGGMSRRWPRGPRMVLLLREHGDSSNRVFSRRVPGFREALAEALDQGLWRVCITDQEMLQALVEIPGALGLVDLGTIRLGGAATRVDVVRVRGLPRGLVKELGFVTLGPPHGLARRFIEFATGPGVQDLLDMGGYRRVPRGPSTATEGAR